MNKNLIELLEQCEDLAYLNIFAPYLRETEYRILLIVCGHTKHGKVPISQVKPILDEYWKATNYKCHLKNVAYILTVALRKIQNERMFQSMNAIS
jgi:galactokinase/mevalonate kinase-like predicted kinase